MVREVREESQELVSELQSEGQGGLNLMKKERKSNAGRGDNVQKLNSGRESGKGLLKIYNNHRYTEHILKVFLLFGYLIISLDF